MGHLDINTGKYVSTPGEDGFLDDDEDEKAARQQSGAAIAPEETAAMATAARARAIRDMRGGGPAAERARAALLAEAKLRQQSGAAITPAERANAAHPAPPPPQREVVVGDDGLVRPAPTPDAMRQEEAQLRQMSGAVITPAERARMLKEKLAQKGVR